MFIGPSGCGKTHIWRCLQKLYPNRIEIADSSNLTQRSRSEVVMYWQIVLMGQRIFELTFQNKEPAM